MVPAANSDSAKDVLVSATFVNVMYYTVVIITMHMLMIRQSFHCQLREYC